MARKATKEQVMTHEVDTAEVPVSTTILWGDKEVQLADLPNHAVHYLIQYGAKQSFADATAGMKKDLAEKGESEEAIGAALAAAQAERWERILAGTIQIRAGGGVRISSDDKIRNDIAKGMILDAAKAKGKKAPTTEALGEMVKAVRERYADRIEAELQRRKAATQVGDELDLEAL